MIGLGLGDEKDITIKGLEAIKKCKTVYLEHYTAVIGCPVERLEKFYDKKITLADREMVEQGCETILQDALDGDSAFLVVGDVFAATTHNDLMMRAVEKQIQVKVVHNASIMNACSACGLQLYNFGACVSICFFTDTWKPDSFYDKVLENRRRGLHTLCLLDIKVKEQSFENMAKDNKVYEPPRFMTINTCVEQMLEVEDMKKANAYDRKTLVIGMARVGQDNQCIISGSMEELLAQDFGGPLHSLVIPGELHFLENAVLDHFHWDRENRQRQTKQRIEEEELERQRVRDEAWERSQSEAKARERERLRSKEKKAAKSVRWCSHLECLASPQHFAGDAALQQHVHAEHESTEEGEQETVAGDLGDIFGDISE